MAKDKLDEFYESLDREYGKSNTDKNIDYVMSLIKLRARPDGTVDDSVPVPSLQSVAEVIILITERPNLTFRQFCEKDRRHKQVVEYLFIRARNHHDEVKGLIKQLFGKAFPGLTPKMVISFLKIWERFCTEQRPTPFVKAVLYPEKSKEILETLHFLTDGEIGKGYVASPSASVPNTYVVSDVEGDVSGVFTESTQTVTYVYGDYIPDNLKNYGDINKDGKIDLEDVTAFQRILAEFDPISEEDFANLDFDCDGRTSVSDITMLQRYLAEYRVSEGTVIVNYFYDDADGNQKTLTDTITINGRVGDPFTTSKYYVMGYQLDESRLPKVTEGMIRFGAPLYVNYYYILGSPDVNLHFKHSGSLAWAPTLWVWGSGLDGKDAGNYSGGTWPGRAATLNEETGWYDYDFTFTGAGTYNVIVSNGGKTQTVDCKGFGYNEMWVVIDDSKIDSGNYLTFYDDNPETNPSANVISFHN